MEKINQAQLEELHIELSDHADWQAQLLVELNIQTLADLPKTLYKPLIYVIRQKKFEEDAERYFQSQYDDWKEAGFPEQEGLE